MSWVCNPANNEILSAAGEQHDLSIPALDEVETATWIQCDGFKQIEVTSWSRVRAADRCLICADNDTKDG